MKEKMLLLLMEFAGALLQIQQLRISIQAMETVRVISHHLSQIYLPVQNITIELMLQILLGQHMVKNIRLLPYIILLQLYPQQKLLQ